MDSMTQVGTEQLTAQLKVNSELDHEIFVLQSEDESLQQRLKEQAEKIQEHLNCKRVVSWLEHEINKERYDDQ